MNKKELGTLLVWIAVMGLALVAAAQPTPFFISCSVFDANDSFIHVPTDYPTVQEAVDNATRHSIIYIHDGEHEGRVTIEDKDHLKIVGESKDAKLLIRHAGTQATACDMIKINNSSNIQLTGFTAVVKGRENPPTFVRAIGVYDSDNISLTNLVLGHESWDESSFLMKIVDSRDCNVSDNIMSGSVDRGLRATSGVLIASTNNTIYNNTIYNCRYSIKVTGKDNTIYSNNLFFTEVTKQSENKNAIDTGHRNHWNSTEPMNYTGNYWSDYTGADNNSDGIGDTPYRIERDAGTSDHHPLIEPYKLTFDVGVVGVARPSTVYVNRNNTILAAIVRSGTYPVSKDAFVNLTVNGSEVESERITIGIDEEHVVRFEWKPTMVDDYTLEVKITPMGEIREASYKNNELEVDVSAVKHYYSYPHDVDRALDFLSTNKSLLPTGSISGFSNSGWAALGLIAAGENPSTGRWKPYNYSIIDYLRNKPMDEVIYAPSGSNPFCLGSLEAIARMVMVISAVGEDPTNYGSVNYLVMLKSYYDGEQFGDNSTARDDALAILALVSCGEGYSGMVNDSVDYIRKNQNSDGGWSHFRGESSIEVTSLVIQALVAAGENPFTYTKNGTTPLDYLRNNQEDEGGFSDVRTTSSAIQAIVAAGETPSSYTKNGNNPLRYLLSLQQEDGSFNYTTDMSLFPPVSTTHSIQALCGVPHPVMIKTLGNEYAYEVPDVSVRQIAIGDEICVNTSYTVSADVRCNGGIFDVNLSSDEGLIQRGEVNSVWHESLSTVSFTWKPNRTGVYNLTIFADSNDRIKELTDVNNNLTRRVEVVYPDLYPANITPPDRTYVNVTNVINCTIRGTTDEHFNVTLLEADGELIGKQRIEGIRDNVSISFEWRPSENRTYNPTLTVDSDNEVRERENDASNVLIVPINVLLPDMTLADPRADEGVAYVNARNRINVTVRGMAECFNVSLIENGTVVGKTCNVTCYGENNITIYWKPATLGKHTVTAFVDSDYDVRETNEANNNRTATFEVVRPDLVPVEITPHVLYIDEVNTINVVVNGAAEGFNATLMVKPGIDSRGHLYYVITPVFDGAAGVNRTFAGSYDDSSIVYDITSQKDVWSWRDIDMLDIDIETNTSTGAEDTGDVWSVDYAAVVVNYTGINSTIEQTLELNASEIISRGNWSDEDGAYISDDEYATATEITSMQLGITDTDAIYGNISSVVLKVEQHVLNRVTPFDENDTLIQKKTNLNTYNGSIEFEWLTMEFEDYDLTVFLDSDNDINETEERNNNLTEVVYVGSRIDLELTAPIGGETWAGIQNITWNATYEEPLRIDLFCSPDRGYRWINITTNETNDGLYAWNTKDMLDGEYMLKVVARSGVFTEEDKSDIFYVRNTKAGEWGSFHANAGYAPCDAPDTNEIAWVSDDIGAEGSSSLIVARGKIFVYCTGWQGMYSDYTYLVALDNSDGEILWGTPIKPRVYGSWATPAYKDGSVFVTSGGSTGGGGYVYRIDASDGEKEWDFRFPGGKGSVNGGPAVTNRAVYAGDWDGCRYYCIDKKNGTEIWNFTVSGYSQSVPAIGYGNAYFGSAYSDEKRAYCVDAWGGEEIWNTTLAPFKNVCGSVTIADNIIYLTTYDFNGAGIFYALDAFNGTEIWSATIEPTDSTPAYYPSPCKSVRGRIYTSGGGSKSSVGTPAVRCLDAKTGELIWCVHGLGSWTNSPVVTKDGKVFVGKECSGGGVVPGYCGLYCLDAFTGKEKWHSERGGSSPVVVNGLVYTIGEGRVLVFGNGTMPDLTVEAKKSGKYVVEKKGNITAIVENTGKSNVTEPFEVVLRYSGELEEPPIDQITVKPPFNVSEPKTISFVWVPDPERGRDKKHTHMKEYKLTVEVDPIPGNVTESDPWNNIANVTVDVENNKPDLISSISAPETIPVGETVPVDITIKNEGYETNESFFLRFFDDMGTSEEMNISLNGYEPKSLNFTWTAPDEPERYRLTVLADSHYEVDENIEYNNRNWVYINVTEPTPTPTPTPTPPPEKPGFGPGSGGGSGGGSAGGIGEGSGTGKAGSGEAGGMQIPVNASSSAEETKKEVFGYPFGNASSGASGGGGTLPILLLLLAVLVITLFYFGYYREKRSHAKHISPGDESKKKQHREIKNKK